MLDFSNMGNSEKASLARKFIKDFSGCCELKRDDFDLWLIDNDLIDDPGTDNPASLEYKGFVQQRTRARTALNRWAEKLPEGESFAVEVNKAVKDVYLVNQWSFNAFALASDIGRRVDTFAKNKDKAVARLHEVAIKKGEDGQDIKELTEMIGQVRGYGLVMMSKINDETKKFNDAVRMIEQKF